MLTPPSLSLACMLARSLSPFPDPSPPGQMLNKGGKRGRSAAAEDSLASAMGAMNGRRPLGRSFDPAAAGKMF